jgi:hypothetical protein
MAVRALADLQNILEWRQSRRARLWRMLWSWKRQKRRKVTGASLHILEATYVARDLGTYGADDLPDSAGAVRIVTPPTKPGEADERQGKESGG